RMRLALSNTIPVTEGSSRRSEPTAARSRWTYGEIVMAAKKSRLTEMVKRLIESQSVGSVHRLIPHRLCLVPVAGDDRPHHLIQIFTVLQERSAKDAFLHRAQLPQGAVAAAVLNDCARLEAIHLGMLEREVDGGPGTREKQPRSPERRAN